MISLPTVPGGFPCIASDNPWAFKDKGSRLAPDQTEKLAGGRGYRTLSIAEMMALPVREIVAPDAFLFLWAPDAHILDGSAAKVARAWGFTPKRIWTWVKRRPFYSYWPGTFGEIVGYLENELRGEKDRLLRAWLQGRRREIKAILRDAKGGDLGGRLAFSGGHYVRTADEKVLICRRGRARFLVRNERSVFFAPRQRAPSGEIHSTKPVEFLVKVERVCVGPRLELFARRLRPGWVCWGDQLPDERSAA